MVLKTRIAVQRRVDEGKVIGLAVILDGELPVAVEREADRGIGAGMDKRLLEFPPAFDQRRGGLLEGRGLAADIHEDDIAPQMRANADQRQVACLDAVMAVDVGPADMRRAAQIPVEIIGPGVIRAGDRAAKLHRFLDKDHAAMTADILEHVDVAGRVADHQHRNAEKGHRPWPCRGWRCPCRSRSPPSRRETPCPVRGGTFRHRHSSRSEGRSPFRSATSHCASRSSRVSLAGDIAAGSWH